MTATAGTFGGPIVELDERESDGVRITLAWNRATDRLVVLVWDERTAESFALDIADGDDPYDVFNHPFAYAAFRERDADQPMIPARALTSA